jgi:hypothetical protein
MSAARPPLDVSTSVRAALPARLTHKLTEIEAAIDRQVTFRRVDAVQGGAHGGTDVENAIVYLLPQAVDNMSVIGEELMHLHRWHVGGYPKAKALQPAECAGYASGLHQIGGHFDEHAFFPFLEEMGLAPRDEVGAVMQNTARMLRLEIPEIQRDGETEFWRVVLSAIYVQARLIAPADIEDRDSVLRLYQLPELVHYARLGGLVEREIVAAQQEGPLQVAERLERCFLTHLGLGRDAVLVVMNPRVNQGTERVIPGPEDPPRQGGCH